MKIKTFLSSFYLKIIAMVFMTIDHIGVLIIAPLLLESSPWYLLCRILGRIAFPLFAFLIVEGVTHSQHKKNYLGRLWGSAIIMGGILGVSELFLGTIGIYNFLLDLALGATIVFFLSWKDYEKLYALIPFAIYISLLVFDAHLPSYLRLGYHFYGVLMIVCFYLAKVLATHYHKVLSNRYLMEENDFEDMLPKQNLSNLFAIAFLLIINLVNWMVASTFPSTNVLNASLQAASILGGIFLLFYSGKKGYTSKIFQYGCYLYYPLHLVILYLLYLIF